MITKNDLDGAIENAVGQISGAVIKALENVATKDDLKNYATKDDLKNLATKDDLKNYATKDDLKNLATKDGLKEVEDRLDGVEKELKIINRKIDILQKTTPNQAEFSGHGKRISRLEKAVFVTP